MDPARRTFVVAVGIATIMAVVAAYVLIDAAGSILPGLDMSDIAAVTVAALLSLTAWALRQMCAGPAGNRRLGGRTAATRWSECGTPSRDHPT